MSAKTILLRVARVGERGKKLCAHHVYILFTTTCSHSRCYIVGMLYTAYGTDIGIVSMSLLHIVYVIMYQTYLIHIQFLLQYDISLLISQNKKGIGKELLPLHFVYSQYT